ncbi:MAG: chordopoxvirus fusion protein [Candidatus Tectomicrobia bacterium]|nr:chordopoxvirus fusion protein [Candidatus Tectomicrobia bacterium]
MANFSGIIEDKLKKVFSEEQVRVLGEVLSDVKALTERELVKAGDFNELKGIVKDLAEAQRASEARLGRLEAVVTELAEAQKRTEERLGRLEAVVTELAEAQKRTEERLGRLEAVVEELAEAQRRMEEAIEKLIVGLTNTRTDLGGLQRSFGYMLENEAYRSLPSIMREKFGIEVKERFLRKYMKLADGTEVEINVLGKGMKNGEEITIIGEAKSILEGKDVDRFLEVLEGLKDVIRGPVFKVFVTHSTRPSVERFAMNNDIQVVYTYEL